MIGYSDILIIGHIYVGMQKDEFIVHYRLREVLAREKEESQTHLKAAIEARKTMCLAQEEVNRLIEENENYKALAAQCSCADWWTS